jgi:tetratricopeptide (TPR) repeat protein
MPSRPLVSRSSLDGPGLSDPAAAAARARSVLARSPADADAHRLLGRSLRALGEDDEAEEAELAAIDASVHDEDLMRAAEALLGNRLPVAEAILRPRLKEKPNDVAAIRMMAELAARIGRFADAENLLRRALELAPGFTAARSNLATIFHKQNRPAEAIAVLEGLLRHDPNSPAYQNLMAASMSRIGNFDEALALYAQLLGQISNQPRLWMSYAHLLKTVGKLDDSVAAYRKALAIMPSLGEVWWSLANLKTVQMSEADIAAMSAALDIAGLGDDDRLHLHFALGKACQDQGESDASFHHFAEGNRLRRAALDYRAGDTTAHVERARTLFTPAFFAEREGAGCPSDEPIFILGLPRAGSTLIEQVLASHSRVEGTMELPDLPALAARLGGPEKWPDALASLGSAELKALGEEYLERTRIRRKSGKPRFIDKLPNNWAHIGLIHAILPNAAIIDARRHPLDCCFSNFRQHFARGQAFTYALDDIGLYYRDYVALMANIDQVLPGRVHRIFHENVVTETEREVRRLLDHLNLPFEDKCLRFYENDRAVVTASSEQVRRPINREGMDQWRPYERWLGPLRQALGPVLDHYPEVPPGP